MSSAIDSQAESLEIQSDIYYRDQNSTTRIRPGSSTFEHEDNKPVREGTIPNTIEKVNSKCRRVQKAREKIQKLKVEAIAKEAAIMAQYDDLQLYNDRPDDMMRYLKEENEKLKNEVKTLRRNNCYLTEKLNERISRSTKSVLEHHVNTVELGSMASKPKSKTFSTSKAFWDKLDKTSSVMSTSCVSGYSSPGEKPSKAICTLPMATTRDLEPAKNQPNNAYGVPNSADNCPIECSELSDDFVTTCTQSDKNEPARMDGKLEISLAESVLPLVQTIIQQNGTAKIEAQLAKLENAIRFNEIKLDTFVWNVKGLTEKRPQDAVVECSNCAGTRKETVANAPEITDTACTFPECECHMAGSGRNVAAQAVDNSQAECKKKNRLQNWRELFKPIELCTTGTLDTATKAINQCLPRDNETMNSRSANRSGKSNEATECSRTTKCCKDRPVQLSSWSISDNDISKENDCIRSSTNKCKRNDESCEDRFLKYCNSTYCYADDIVPIIKTRRKIGKKSKDIFSKNCCPYSHGL